MGSARITVDVFSEGWDDAAVLLEKIPLLVRGKELESSIRKGLGLVRTRARQLVPQPGYPGDKPGLKALKDTIGVVLRRYRGGALIAGIVGPEYPAGAHGHLVEAGTKPHRVTTRNAKALVSSDTFFGAAVNHPGADPRPFMEPAYQEVKPRIEPLIISSLQKAIVKHGG